MVFHGSVRHLFLNKPGLRKLNLNTVNYMYMKSGPERPHSKGPADLIYAHTSNIMACATSFK